MKPIKAWAAIVAGRLAWDCYGDAAIRKKRDELEDWSSNSEVVRVEIREVAPKKGKAKT